MVKGVRGFAPDPFNHLQPSLFSVFRKNKLKKRPEPRHYSSLQVVFGVPNPAGRNEVCKLSPACKLPNQPVSCLTSLQVA